MIRYNVNVQYLNGREEGERKPIRTRTIQTYENIDDAIKKLVKVVVADDCFATITEDEVRECIEEEKEWFESGKPIRWIKAQENIFDCDGKTIYIGPGAFTITKTVLQ